MIQKSGHGSGFFITKEGHILTNQHVVGDAKQMRIVTPDKKHKLVAEVLRIDKVRDVALLKLTEIPKTLDIVTLPIRPEKLTVSEDIYAIGAPHSYKTLQDTVSKGIVSGHKSLKIESIRLPYFQGDVSVHKGNSGGPVLDKNGNIVGLSVLGYHVPQTSYGVGLSFFIPITEALRALNITLNDERPERYKLSDEDDNLSEFYETPLSLAP